MNSEISPERGWRGSRELWLGAATEALIEGGIDAVKILPLAKKLGLSRTSFYWFFKDREALLEALLAHWEAVTTRPLLTASREYAATETEAMLNLVSIFLSDEGFNARLDSAVRAWGRQDPAVLPKVHEADEQRRRALKELLQRWGHSEPDADVRAWTIYLVQMGYIALQLEETLETRLARFPDYVQVYTTRYPTDEEMARFKARLGLNPEFSR